MINEISSNPFDSLPSDVLPLIVKKLTLELDIVALVCKTWQEVADSPAFRPQGAMGVPELQKFNPNIIFEGKESIIPRVAFRHLNEKTRLLFFNPGKVKIKNAEGKVVDLVLNSLKNIDIMFEKKIGFKKPLWEEAINDKRAEEPAHWTLLDTEVLGLEMTYEQQEKMAAEEDEKAYPERYKQSDPEIDKKVQPKKILKRADINNLHLGMLMARCIFEKTYFKWSHPGNGFLIRVPETSICEKMSEIAIGFTDNGIMVSPTSNSFPIRWIGFACMRKSQRSFLQDEQSKV